MFGVSKTTVSHLANCEARALGRIHRYPDVFREWVRLGPEAFLEAYVTEDNYIKAQRLKYNVDDGHKLDDRNGMHLDSNPRADACAHHMIGELNMGTWRARIDWAECSPEVPEDKRGPIGWRYCDVSGPSSPYFSIDPNVEPFSPKACGFPGEPRASASTTSISAWACHLRGAADDRENKFATPLDKDNDKD